MIGIGIISHNRPEVLGQAYQEQLKYLPKNAKLVIVDDASIEPIEFATYRFDRNVGIAQAKNKCFELLQDCDYIFIFEDDCYPIVKDWWKPYVHSQEPHLMYMFQDFIDQRLGDSKLLYVDSEIKAYSHPRGCMLYLTRKVLSVVGGMDTSYGRWGYEHVDFSNRVFNNYLTSFRFADVVNSSGLIYSADEHRKVASSVPHIERIRNVKYYRAKYMASFKSKEYHEYRET